MLLLKITFRRATIPLHTKSPPWNSACIPFLTKVCFKSDNFGSFIKTAFRLFNLHSLSNACKLYSSSSDVGVNDDGVIALSNCKFFAFITPSTHDNS